MGISRHSCTHNSQKSWGQVLKSKFYFGGENQRGQIPIVEKRKEEEARIRKNWGSGKIFLVPMRRMGTRKREYRLLTVYQY